MAPIAKAHDVSVAQIALAWLLQRSGVMSVIIGAKTIEQLNDNLAAVKVVLSADEVAALDKASALDARISRLDAGASGGAAAADPCGLKSGALLARIAREGHRLN